MGSSIQLVFGAVPCHYTTAKSYFTRSSSYFSVKNYVKGKWDKDILCEQLKGPVDFQGCLRVQGRGAISRLYSVGKLNRRLETLSCKCQRTESVSQAIVEVGSGKSVNGMSEPSSLQSLEGPKLLNNEKTVITSDDEIAAASEMSDTLQGFGINSIEDEAWNLLRASIVYYCGNPIGTIAANDPSAANILNYDQIFIRDFIPSGMAFLLKGEYDIVRNFILHTLQLQVNYKHFETSHTLCICTS